ncbi:GNAT family protein [Dongia soli]|uniref:GNAT family protein n=1 Tax=Dongia soli TaxID=600628 RepID=A0ABU5EC80_9PROT|nr:GNAT family protein [Dongia soli]MDY0883966.1 GNAT family protein [Dongia soli]
MFGKGPHFSPPPPLLRNARVYLRPPQFGDFRQWARLRGESQAFLEPWEPSWGEEALSRATYRDRTTRMARDWRADVAYSFHIFERTNDRLVGGVNLNSVRRGVAQAASIGYWLGQQYARQGLMSATLALALPFAFHDLHLHRVEAACLGGNDASRTLLHKFGFQPIGIAHSCLKINGFWQDHMLFDLILENLLVSRGMAEPVK